MFKVIAKEIRVVPPAIIRFVNANCAMISLISFLAYSPNGEKLLKAAQGKKQKDANAIPKDSFLYQFLKVLYLAKKKINVTTEQSEKLWDDYHRVNQTSTSKKNKFQDPKEIYEFVCEKLDIAQDMIECVPKDIPKGWTADHVIHVLRGDIKKFIKTAFPIKKDENDFPYILKGKARYYLKSCVTFNGGNHYYVQMREGNRIYMQDFNSQTEIHPILFGSGATVLLSFERLSPEQYPQKSIIPIEVQHPRKTDHPNAIRLKEIMALTKDPILEEIVSDEIYTITETLGPFPCYRHFFILNGLLSELISNINQYIKTCVADEEKLKRTSLGTQKNQLNRFLQNSLSYTRQFVKSYVSQPQTNHPQLKELCEKIQTLTENYLTQNKEKNQDNDDDLNEILQIAYIREKLLALHKKVEFKEFSQTLETHLDSANSKRIAFIAGASVAF